MFCEIKLKPKSDFEEEAVEEIIWDCLAVLNKSGQILNGYTVVKKQGYYSLYVTLPHKDSLSEKYGNTYTKRNWNKLKQYFRMYKTVLGTNLSSDEYCNCTSYSAIEMQTYLQDINSVFICCDCGKPIALYKLPVWTGYDDYANIISWQEDYSALDAVWMNCGMDKISGKQLFDPDSLLNANGRKIADELAQKLGCKVYYHIGDDVGFYKPKTVKRVKTENGKRVLCPSCGEQMHPKQVADYTIHCCDECSLSFDDD